MPRAGQHIAWAESSAVVFANSVIKAYTNREGGPSALASALTGRTPLFGYQLDSERKPTYLVEIAAPLDSTTDYSMLGYYVGKRIGKGVPLFRNLGSTSVDQLKALSAGLATSGGIAMFLSSVQDIHDTRGKELERIAVDNRELSSVADVFLYNCSKPDLVCVGCPHFSQSEISHAEKLVERRKVKDGIDFWLCTSSFMKQKAIGKDLAKRFEKAGVRIVSDTCFVVSP